MKVSKRNVTVITIEDGDTEFPLYEAVGRINAAEVLIQDNTLVFTDPAE